MWRNVLNKIIQEKVMYGEKVNEGAELVEINSFIQNVNKEFSINIPKDYLDFLKEINGLEFNGFIIYGIDQKFLINIQNQNVGGFIEYNKIWYENEWQKKYIFIGESNISWYVFDLNNYKYYELDNPSGNINCSYETFENLLEKILSDSLL